MSDVFVVVTSSVIGAAVTPSTNYITQVMEIRDPIISASQGPQGIQGLKGDTGERGPANYGTLLMSNISDINMSGLVDGAVLVYDMSSTTWNTTKSLDKQIIECGHY